MILESLNQFSCYYEVQVHSFAQYDADMAKVGYNGPAWTKAAVAGLGLSKHVKIIDVLAGSGMVAKNVSKQD